MTQTFTNNKGEIAMGHGIDILAFGAHPDDVEIGMAGSLAKWATAGKQIVICDLTEAELSSNGDVETRRKESNASAEILGIVERVNLNIPDRGLFKSDDNIRKIVNIIRKYQPTVIFAPYQKDRHPDHGNCSELVREAFFSAGIRKYKGIEEFPAHKAKGFYHYLINGFTNPNFMVDISNYIDYKIKALEAYQSQFYSGKEGISTPLTEGYIETVVAREKLFGKEVDVAYAEGFISGKPLLINHDLFGEVV